MLTHMMWGLGDIRLDWRVVACVFIILSIMACMTSMATCYTSTTILNWCDASTIWTMVWIAVVSLSIAGFMNLRCLSMSSHSCGLDILTIRYHCSIIIRILLLNLFLLLERLAWIRANTVWNFLNCELLMLRVWTCVTLNLGLIASDIVDKPRSLRALFVQSGESTKVRGGRSSISLCNFDLMGRDDNLLATGS